MSKRDEIIKGLRTLADLLEDQPDFPAPYDVELPIFYSSLPNGRLGPPIIADDARAAMAVAPGGWSKDYSDSYVTYRKDFSEVVALELILNREAVCRKVQVGVKHIEATEARDIPVYEWVCESDELEPVDD